ncbi:hypothetical protein [Sandaracinus amylolyticus]|uniref:hypothetical protein n=1 Tax=Sandaracinus amylolyticus TaxID=927083 RepID=UPI001F22150A|nr:hypothetical protein [Sandaracinus amylolyticus]UJR85461.1 Hypothetical protein I5071_75410 [Sandaracinus amylolyticus]
MCGMIRPALVATLVAASMLLAACYRAHERPAHGDGSPGSMDAGDAPRDAGIDASLDGPRDASLDGPRDASLDGLRDASLDGPRDASLDGPRDASLDGSMDGSRDASFDGSMDGSRDASFDAPADASFDGSVDAAPDASFCGEGFGVYTGARCRPDTMACLRGCGSDDTCKACFDADPQCVACRNHTLLECIVRDACASAWAPLACCKSALPECAESRALALYECEPVDPRSCSSEGAALDQCVLASSHGDVGRACVEAMHRSCDP